MATPMSKQLAAIFAAVADDRQRIKETNSDDRLNRSSAENAIDLSHAIFVREIMAIQNEDIAERVAARVVSDMMQVMITAIETILNGSPISKVTVEDTEGETLTATFPVTAGAPDDDRR